VRTGWSRTGDRPMHSAALRVKQANAEYAEAAGLRGEMQSALKVASCACLRGLRAFSVPSAFAFHTKRTRSTRRKRRSAERTRQNRARHDTLAPWHLDTFSPLRHFVTPPLHHFSKAAVKTLPVESRSQVHARPCLRS
jgi:hypothetical protein